MSALPLSLRSWEAPLSVLDPALAPALGSLLVRLAAALGPFGVTTKPGGDEPDGYAGITRRGPLERLLTTEWALLDEAPEEFIRRLSTGELSYLDPETKTQAQERRCLVLFDSGPEQLGPPRLAQLAAWIVLTQRAHAGGATLQWATLDTPALAENLHTGFDAPGVRTFLESRTARQADSTHLFAWRKWAEQAQGSPDELWLLGGRHWLSAPMAKGVHLLCTEEEDSGHALNITLKPNRKRFSLELPPVQVQIRLLRDPFPRPTIPQAKTRASHRPVHGALVWLPGARGVCARSADDTGVVCFPVPSKQGAALGQPRLYQPNWGGHESQILAVGGARSAIFGVLRWRNRLRIQVFKGSLPEVPQGVAKLSDESARLLDATALALTSCVLQQGTLRLHVGSTRSLLLRKAGTELEASWSNAKAAHLATLQNTLSVHFSADETALRQYDAVDLWKKIGELGVSCVDALFFAGPRARESVVVLRRDGRWYFPLETKELAFPELDPNDTLLGACYFGGQVRLVTLSEAGRLIRLVGLGAQRTITGIGGKLVSAAVAPDQPLLACLRESGDLVVWDLEANARACLFAAPAARQNWEHL